LNEQFSSSSLLVHLHFYMALIGKVSYLIVVFQATDDSQVKKRKKTNEQGVKSNKVTYKHCCC